MSGPEEIRGKLDGWVDRLNDGERVRSGEAENESEAAALRWLETLNAPGALASSKEIEGMVGKHLGPYLLVATVAEGGQGNVYEAIHDSLERKVALKVLPHQFGRTPKQIARFSREARAVASLNHEGIVPIFEVGQSDGVHFFAMEYVDGAPLSDLIRERKKVSQGENAAEVLGELGASVDTDDLRWFVGLILDAAEALGYAHRHGVIHRDIKPSNILVGLDGRARISDFGLARIEAETSITRTGIRFGTLSYMSPEHVEGQNLDTRSDVFSLGVTLYELVTLKKPFPGSREGEILYQIANEDPERPRKVRMRIDRDLEAIILRAIEKNPDQRYPNGDGFAADLRRYLAHEPVEARPWTVPMGIRKWIQRNPRTTLAISLLIIGFAIAGIMANEYRRQSDVLAGIRQSVRIEQAAEAVREGVLHLARGAYGAARVQFMNALSAEPGMVEAELLVVLALARTNNPDKYRDAKARVTGLLESQPQLAGAHLLNSILLDQVGQGDEADEARSRAERLESKLPVELYLQAAVDAEAGRLNEALLLFDRAIAARPEAIEYLFSRQRCFVDLFDDQRAFGDAWIIVHIAPENPWAHRNLGDVCLITGRTTEAISAYRRAIDLNPIDHETRLRLSAALTLCGKGREGEDELHELRSSLADDSLVWSTLALAQLRWGSAEALCSAIRERKKDDDDDYAMRVLGDCVAADGRLDEAFVAYSKAKESTISRSAAAYGLALVAARNEDEAACQAAFELASEPVVLGGKDWLRGLFWIRPLIVTGEGQTIDDLLSILQRVVRSTEGREPLCLATYAATLHAADRKKKARQVLADALAASSSNHFVRVAVGQLAVEFDRDSAR